MFMHRIKSLEALVYIGCRVFRGSRCVWIVSGDQRGSIGFYAGNMGINRNILCMNGDQSSQISIHKDCLLVLEVRAW
jgi:hypothetical protein